MKSLRAALLVAIPSARGCSGAPRAASLVGGRLHSLPRSVSLTRSELCVTRRILGVRQTSSLLSSFQGFVCTYGDICVVQGPSRAVCPFPKRALFTWKTFKRGGS